MRPDCLDVMRRVKNLGGAPLLTGHDAAEHPAIGHTVCGTIPVTLKDNCRATHLHAHRDYWAGVMPIQSRGLHTPCKPEIMPESVREAHQRTGETRGMGSEVDHWITHRAPNSVVKQGGHVVCVPGLVRTFLWKAEDSCWANPQRAGEDPVLNQVWDEC